MLYPGFGAPRAPGCGDGGLSWGVRAEGASGGHSTPFRSPRGLRGGRAQVLAPEPLFPRLRNEGVNLEG